MADLADRILQYLAENASFNTLDLANKWDVDHQKIVGAIKSLQAKGDVSHSIFINLCTNLHSSMDCTCRKYDANIAASQLSFL